MCYQCMQIKFYVYLVFSAQNPNPGNKLHLYKTTPCKIVGGDGALGLKIIMSCKKKHNTQ